MRALHVRPASGLTVHDAAAEVAVVERWAQLFAAHAIGGEARKVARRSRSSCRRSPSGCSRSRRRRAVPLHRTLHDGQMLIDDTGHVAILDFDALAAGEAALDLANLLVHLELSELLGTPVDRAQAAANGVREGYALDPVTGARLDAYADAARLRLVCRYAFCPSGGLAVGLLDRFSPAPAPRRFVRTRSLERI